MVHHAQKVDFLNLLYDIGGVALQANVNMEADRNGEVRELRDWFFTDWGDASEGKKAAAGWVGRVMSHIYASTVLVKYVDLKQTAPDTKGWVVRKETCPLHSKDNDGPDTGTNAIVLYEGDFRRDGERSLTAEKIKERMRDKDFTKSEWPVIKAFSKGQDDGDLFLYIVYYAPETAPPCAGPSPFLS